MRFVNFARFAFATLVSCEVLRLGSLNITTLDAWPSNLSVICSELILIAVHSAGVFGKKVGTTGRVVGIALLFLIDYLRGIFLLDHEQLHMLGVVIIHLFSGGILSVARLDRFLWMLVDSEKINLGLFFPSDVFEYCRNFLLLFLLDLFIIFN